MLPEGIQSEMGLHISKVHSWQGIKILILLQLLKSGCSFSPQKWNTMVMIKLVQTSMCQTCGRVRCLMLDVYRVMQFLVDKAVSHSCKPDVFKLQKILSLFYYPLCNTLRIQDAVLWTIFFMIKFGNGRAPAISKSWPITLSNVFCVSLVLPLDECLPLFSLIFYFCCRH